MKPEKKLDSLKISRATGGGWLIGKEHEGTRKRAQCCVDADCPAKTPRDSGCRRESWPQNLSLPCAITFSIVLCLKCNKAVVNWVAHSTMWAALWESRRGKQRENCAHMWRKALTWVRTSQAMLLAWMKRPQCCCHFCCTHMAQGSVIPTLWAFQCRLVVVKYYLERLSVLRS